MTPAGPQSDPRHQVVDLAYDRANRSLSVTFADGVCQSLSAEFLRVHSPSAEVKGHAGRGGRLVVGKHNVTITALEPVGSYAVKIVFDDGHDTGLYSWAYLRDLSDNADAYWDAYQARVSGFSS